MACTALDDRTCALAQRLATILGDAHVLTDDDSTELRSRDLALTGKKPSVVIEPGSESQTAACIEAVTSEGFAVIPRGGGLSYTAGLTPVAHDSVVIETRRLDQIIEINETDMYVRLGAGVTWENLHNALRELPVRPAFWGTGSGRFATVGGAASQNAMYLGSATNGPASDAIIGLKVCLADGSILTTGSAGTTAEDSSPFFRTYGPDLTGLFLADCGSLGVKSEVTLKLLLRPSETRFCSFAYDTLEDMVDAITQVGRAAIASECSGYDPDFIRLRIARTSLAKDLRLLDDVIRAEGNIFRGLLSAIRIALAGRRTLERGGYTMHVALEGADKTEANYRLDRARSIGRRCGREIESSLPRLARSRPFREPSPIFGPKGTIWLPVNVIVPNSRVVRTFEIIRDVLKSAEDLMQKHDIDAGSVVLPCGPSACLIETNFFFPDAPGAYVEAYFDKAFLADIPRHPPNDDTRSTVLALRRLLAQRLSEFGGVHFQIGKLYPYAQTRQARVWDFLQALKKTLDPKGLMNPGALGFEGHA